MHRILTALILIALPVVAADAAPSGLLSAGYEVVLDAGKDDHYQVRTTSQVAPGKPIDLAFGPYLVTLTIVPRSPAQYDLQVQVRDHAAGVPVGGRRIERAFAGTFGGILEFEAAGTGLKVSGAIAVSRLP